MQVVCVDHSVVHLNCTKVFFTYSTLFVQKYLMDFSSVQLCGLFHLGFRSLLAHISYCLFFVAHTCGSLDYAIQLSRLLCGRITIFSYLNYDIV